MSEIDATAVVPAFNTSVTISRCVNSVLSQSDVNVEVIVVDDCSSDDTLARAEAVAKSDPRVRTFSLTSNAGPSAARNLALKEARGNWIVVIDSDDTILPGRLSRMISFAEAKNADIVVDNFQQMDENGVALQERPYLRGRGYSEPVLWSLEDYVSGNQFNLGGVSLGYLKPIIRRGFLEEYGIIYNEALRNSEDLHLIAECLAVGGKLWFVPEVGYCYTVRDGSISHRVSPEVYEALIRAEDAFLARHDSTINAQVKSLVHQRRHGLLDAATVERVMRSLKGGNVMGAAGALMRRPRAASRLGRHLLEAVSKRL